MRGRLRHELRVTWLGGMRILDRLEQRDYDVFTSRPTLGMADAPSLLWRTLAWSRSGAEGQRQNHERARDELLLFVPRASRRQAQRHRRGLGFLPGRRRCGGRARRSAIPRAPLTEWRDEVARLYEGREPGHAAGTRSSLPYISRFTLPRSAFEDLIDGVAMDLRQTRYATFEELRQYCLRVASAVGLICVEIFGYRDLQTRDYAIDLGIALQLTNIIRDVASDLERGRLYIPAQDLAALRMHRGGSAGGRGDREGAAAAGLSRSSARGQFYEKAEAALPRHDERRLVAARIMGAIYYDLLRAIERAGYDVFRQHVRVSRPRQALIAGVTWLKVMVPLK